MTSSWLFAKAMQMRNIVCQIAFVVCCFPEQFSDGVQGLLS